MVKIEYGLAITLLMLVIKNDAIATQPQRAEAWSECLAESGKILLHLKIQYGLQDYFLLSLNGDTKQSVPFDIVLTSRPIDSTRNTDEVSICHDNDKFNSVCAPTTINVRFYVFGLTECSEIQGQVISVNNFSINPATSSVFVGQVKAYKTNCPKHTDG